MDKTAVLPVSGIILLSIIAAVLLIQNLMIRKELGRFRKQIHEIRTAEREQPVKVASFDASTTELAAEINRLISLLRSRVKSSAEEERRLRTIMAGVSHDFRTPLTAAAGYLQLTEEAVERIYKGLADSRDEQVQEELRNIRDYLSIIDNRIRYLKDLSDEFFEVTYLDAGANLPLETVRFDTLLSDVMLRQYNRITEAGLSVETYIPEENLTVQADRHYLERILENLFSNALKYAGKKISIRVEKPERCSNETAFVIENDMEPSLMPDPERVFEPFYRAKDRSGPGTGLGLYVCRELAAAMDMPIEAQLDRELFRIRLSMKS